MGLVFLKEDLVPKRRNPEIKKESWKEEGPRKKMKIPAGGKILEAGEISRRLESCMERTQGMPGGIDL